MDVATDLSFVQFAGSYIIVIALFAATAWFSLMRGIGSVSAATLAFPLALLIYQASLSAVYLDSLFERGLQHAPTGIALFTVLCVGLYFAIRHVSANTTGGAGNILRAIISGIACTGMFLAVWHAFAPLSTLWHFGDEFDVLFAQEYFFWWLIGTLACTYLSGLATYKTSPVTAMKTRTEKYASGVRYEKN